MREHQTQSDAKLVALIMALKRRNFLLFLGASVGYEVQDDLVLPKGFAHDVIAAWGNKVGDSRFGYNNDYPCLK